MHVRHEYYWLDWLRFCAALMVVATHSRGGLWVEWSGLDVTAQTVPVAMFFALTRAGVEWVLVFFVLSGFLVGGGVVRRVTKGSFSLRSYAIDRVTRIWVPLVPALVWSATVALVVGKELRLTAFVGNVMGLQGVLVPVFAENYPLWSLAYEIGFYGMAGGIAFMLTGQRYRRWIALAAVLLILMTYLKLSFAFLVAWLCGAATLHYVGAEIYRPRLFLGLALAAVGYLLSQIGSPTVSLAMEGWRMYLPSAPLITVILASGVALVLPELAKLEPQSTVMRRFHDLGGALAAFSYTLYLTHYPVLYLWDWFLQERMSFVDIWTLFLYLMKVLSCVLVAWLLYLPFERQTGKLRRWLKRVTASP